MITQSHSHLRNRTWPVILFVCLLCTTVLGRTAQKTPAAPAKPGAKSSMPQSHAITAHPIVTPDSLKWADFLPGAQVAVVSGDPSKPGPFVVRLKSAAGTILAAHWHPTTENVTILQGTFAVGMGDKFDASKLTKMEPGGFVSVPARAHHYARSETETVVQVHGAGPFVITFVDPADDPRIKK